SEIKPFIARLASRHYARLVERHLIKVPATESPDAPALSLPTTTTPWEVGDDVRSIDWLASVLNAGEMAGAMPLRREMIPDDSPRADGEIPNIEIYLDTSGSMPDPQRRTNAMSLAAQILATATTRQGGRVRGIIYSSGPPHCSDWIANEAQACAFFMNYSGGGTDYPFKHLNGSCKKWPGALRVILSDQDFLYNIQQEGSRGAFEQALDQCPMIVCMLHLHYNSKQAKARLDTAFGSLQGHPSLRLLHIQDLTGFASAASALSRALFDD
ncbi:MAG: hypothetical protein QF464_17630, partial [Myxococcota bacterium]|nr:hypothetical protein [Myxococcota bacterium]